MKKLLVTHHDLTSTKGGQHNLSPGLRGSGSAWIRINFPDPDPEVKKNNDKNMQGNW